MADPLDIPKYRNAPHAAYTIIKEEGVRALYKGVTLTALRQGLLQVNCLSLLVILIAIIISHQSSCQFHCISRNEEIRSKGTRFV
jgi:hypothetical protein